MAVSPFEIIAGPAEVFTAPTGSTFPGVANKNAPGSPWVSLGETEGGVTVQHQQNTVELRTDQRIGVKKIIRAEETIRITFQMAELELENMAKVLNDQTVSENTDDREFDLYRGVDVNQLAMLIRGDSPYADKFLQYELPRVSQVGQPSVAFMKNDKSVMAVEFIVLEDPNASSDNKLFGTVRAGE